MLEDKIDAMLQMQLVDLARMFTKRKELEVEAAFHADYEESSARITVSQFWWDYPPLDKASGMKSDVYLRGIGTACFTSAAAVKSYLKGSQQSSLPKLANSLLPYVKICDWNGSAVLAGLELRVFSRRDTAFMGPTSDISCARI